MKAINIIRCSLALTCLVAMYSGCKSESGSDADAGEDGSKPDAGQSDGSGSDSDSDTDSDTDTDTDGDGDTDAGINCFRYVDVDSTSDSPDGLLWDTAFTEIQEGIDSAYYGSMVVETNACEVWVAEGKYTIYNGNREDTLQLRPGVHLYGGFKGTESSRDKRNWEKNETIISGIHNGLDIPSPVSLDVNHTVTGSDDAVLDGFTITGGQASGYGGGMYNEGCSPKVYNCIFTMNSATKAGAGVYNLNNNAYFENCSFTDSPRLPPLISEGNGMYNENSSPTVIDCVFSGNYATLGGGIYNFNSSPIISNCIFSGNTSQRGGGIYNLGGTPYISDCIFVDNVRTGEGEEGGGIYNAASSPVITNCIFSNNYATGIYNYDNDCLLSNSILVGNRHGGAISNKKCYGEITNCIIAGNVGAGAILNDNGLPYISNSIIIKNWSQYDCHCMDLYFYSNAEIINSILDEVSYSDFCIDADSELNISYSLVSNDFPSGEGNITGDPLFEGNPLMTGVWSSVTYNENSFQTRMKDDASSWDTDELKNMFVQVDEDNEPRWFYIVENTEDTLRVWGDITDYTESGDTYSIFDLHLSENSPCIDTASDDDAPDTDIEGNSRVDVPGKGDNGTAADMGAYEYQP